LNTKTFIALDLLEDKLSISYFDDLDVESAIRALMKAIRDRHTQSDYHPAYLATIVERDDLKERIRYAAILIEEILTIFENPIFLREVDEYIKRPLKDFLKAVEKI
jgi:hypothetical protein